MRLSFLTKTVEIPVSGLFFQKSINLLSENTDSPLILGASELENVGCFFSVPLKNQKNL